MNPDYQSLMERVEILEGFMANLQSGNLLELQFEQALKGRGFIKATTKPPKTFYVASSSGGSPTTKVVIEQ